MFSTSTSSQNLKNIYRSSNNNTNPSQNGNTLDYRKIAFILNSSEDKKNTFIFFVQMIQLNSHIDGAINDEFKNQTVQALNSGVTPENQIERNNLDTIIRYSKHQSTGLKQYFSNFYTKSMQDLLGDLGINSNKSIPSNELKAIFTADMNENHRAEIIDALKDVPAAGRVEFVRLATTMFTDDMNGNNRAEIIDALKDVPAAGRVEFVRLATTMFTDDMTGYGRARIIHALKDVPAAERVQVLRLVRTMFTDDMDGHDRGNKINALKDMPADEREKVLRLGANYSKSGRIAKI